MLVGYCLSGLAEIVGPRGPASAHLPFSISLAEMDGPRGLILLFYLSLYVFSTPRRSQRAPSAWPAPAAGITGGRYRSRPQRKRQRDDDRGRSPSGRGMRLSEQERIRSPSPSRSTRPRSR